MTIFFFVVGLEIKRELVAGELNDARKATLPIIAAVGGMAVPAVIYIAFNLSDHAEGWGIPMATDIAFAVGVLALFGSRVPTGLKVFVLSLAIVDDIGAILVIALFYSNGISLGYLGAAVILLPAILVLRRSSVSWTPLFAIVGIAVWVLTLKSGVHATIAGVALALITPARSTGAGPSVAERLRQGLHPWTSYAVIPLFALANAGVVLDGDALGDAFRSNVALGVMVGLVAGKLIGITLLSWLAVRLGLGVLPTGVTWRHLVAGGAVAGIGFTVSLFITGLAFEDPAVAAAAKIGVLGGSLVSGILGAALLTLAIRRER